MLPVLTISVVGNRYKVGKALKKVSIGKEYGLITSVKLTKINFFVYHLQFDVETR